MQGTTKRHADGDGRLLTIGTAAETLGDRISRTAAAIELKFGTRVPVDELYV
jgi:hypothetical protein